MLEAIGNGFMSGLVICSFLGPIFFMMIDLGLRGNIRGVIYLGLGTFVSDILTVLFIYTIAKSLAQYTALTNALYVAGGLVLLYIGFKNLMQKDGGAAVQKTQHIKPAQFFIKGFLINSTNPNVFFFWFGAVMLAVNMYRNDTMLVSAHFITTLLMVLVTDVAKGYGASLLRPYVKDNTLLYLSKLSGLIIMGFGLKLIFFH